MKNRLLLSVFLLALPGCASKSPDTVASDCDSHAKVDGVCPGVTSDAINNDGIVCSATINVAPGEESKIASAASGSCVMLANGSFATINLPASVNLIGKGSSSTTVASIAVAPGTSTIRGLKVAGGSIVMNGKGNLTVDAAQITGSNAASIFATDANLTVTRTTITDGASFGVAAGCKTDCMVGRPNLSLRRVMLKGNKAVGVWAHGVNATFEGVQVSQTRVVNFLYGRGFEIAEGGSVKATHIVASDNQDVGIYVDGASAELSSFAVSNNVRGVQLQAIPAGGATLNDFVIENNAALGLGITKGSLGIIVQGGLIASTRPMNVPVDIGGLQEVGDGINWLGGSDVQILNSVKIQTSARRAVIIESTSKGKFEGTLAGGDETRGIIVQGGLEPSMPASLTVASGVKSEVLTKDKAMPVAVSMAAMKAP